MPDTSPRDDQLQSCQCEELDDLAFVPMGGDGLDERVFATIKPALWHGEELWWLGLAQCSACQQFWLVAQDSRIYDIHLLKRLTVEDAEAIRSAGVWPEDFITYERVLKINRGRCNPPYFLEPLAYSLQFTVEDLRNERANITVKEIAYLLGLPLWQARILVWKNRLFGSSKLPG